MASSAQLLQSLDGLNAQQLKRLLVEQLTRQKLGLYWESNAIERDQALNAQVVLPRLVSEWSQGLEGEALAQGAANLIIEGDNFDSLRLLKSTHAGKIRVIYIDPPYNTGNKDWVYNDHYVGANDRWRHSQWLEFLYRRLLLAKDLLTQDGVIMVSINDENRSRLELLMDEVFPGKRLGTITWRTRQGSNADQQCFLSLDHEHVLVYGNPGFKFNGFEKSYEMYSNPDNDPRGDWRTSDLTLGFSFKDRPNLYYPLIDQNTGIYYPPNPERIWVYASEQRLKAGQTLQAKSMDEFIRLGQILFPKDQRVETWNSLDQLLEAIDKGDVPKSGKAPILRRDLPDLEQWVGKPIGFGRPQFKRYKADLRNATQPLSSWVIPTFEDGDYESEGSFVSATNQEGARELAEIFGDRAFNYAKPRSLIQNLISQASRPGDIVLDFFAGSGTTGHAVLNLNALEADKSPRSFILCSSTEATAKEPEKNLCRDVCAERIRRVIASDAKLSHNRFAYLQLDKIAPGDAPFESDCGHAFQLLTMRLGKVARPVPKADRGVKIIIQSAEQGSMTVLVHRLSTAALEALAALPLSNNPRFGHLRVYSSRPVAVREHLERAWDGTRRTVESLSLAKALTQGQIAPRRRSSAAPGDTINSIAPRADSMPASGLFNSENDAKTQPDSAAGDVA
ncbi:site-specific DNA-methyltransferase [Variovorax sp. PCZ-1]|uniref:site-specific DNA-methyltransferase n=1 Tax=Variovorax sp. PCZ-1 TaxID=2835533 RepID=UPI001BCEF8D8|nr:site-specific DNA-methyltransferase [Variovorax sp. PCZ-1]MBS7806301.1 site-specific DNA-methyltransferase [Variovorax sp. PCZ-1]